MFENFTDRARKVMTLAGAQASGLNHQYIGTEHILLGLLEEDSGVSADVLNAFGVHPPLIRLEIEKLIRPGPEGVCEGELPLTPRARRAIDFARDEATIVSQKNVDTEHLLLGLLRESDGVAGKVLLGLGLNLEKLREEALKIRVLQLKIVERAIRPVRAGIARKRKMREELLAHLTAIYETEQARLNDPIAATTEAARRFGDPAELARELEKSLPISERASYYLERTFGWRAPESAARYTLRLASQSFVIVAFVCCLVAVAVALRVGWDRAAWAAVRPALAMLLILPTDLFLLGLLYFKTRDALFGAFGGRKSLFKVVLFQVLFAFVVLASGMAWIALTQSNLVGAARSVYSYCAAALVTSVACLLYARIVGPIEISDTVWACMDIESPTLGIPGAPCDGGSSAAPT